jgi:DNA replication protein DnaC
MGNIQPHNIQKVRTLVTNDDLKHPSYLDSWMIWRSSWTDTVALDRLFKIVGKSSGITREAFVNAIRQRKGMPSGAVCPICEGNLLINDENYGEMWCFCHLVDWHNGWLKRLRSIRSDLRTDWVRTFDNYKIDRARPGSASLALALEASQKYASNPGRSWLVLSGGKGTGKTHLLEAIANSLGKIALYIACYDLGEIIYGATKNKVFDETVNAIQNAPVLLLDDYGVQYPSEWLDAAISRIINYRYGKRDELSTGVGTNLPLKVIGQSVDDMGRSGSRLLDASHTVSIGLDADDIRMRGGSR